MFFLLSFLSPIAEANGLSAHQPQAVASEQWNTSPPSDSIKRGPLETLGHYFLLNYHGLTLASVGLQMDTAQNNLRLQIEGPALQTSTLFRLETMQYTFGKGGSFLRPGLGFVYRVPRATDGMVYDPNNDFGIGMHYSYDWLNTTDHSNHVLGVDFYLESISSIVKVTAEIPSGADPSQFGPSFGVQIGYGGMMKMHP